MSDLPKCPYCGFENDEWFREFHDRQGEPQNTVCIDCNKEYTVTVAHHVVKFKTERK